MPYLWIAWLAAVAHPMFEVQIPFDWLNLRVEINGGVISTPSEIGYEAQESGL